MTPVSVMIAVPVMGRVSVMIGVANGLNPTGVGVPNGLSGWSSGVGSGLSGASVGSGGLSSTGGGVGEAVCKGKQRDETHHYSVNG